MPIVTTESLKRVVLHTNTKSREIYLVINFLVPSMKIHALPSEDWILLSDLTDRSQILEGSNIFHDYFSCRHEQFKARVRPFTNQYHQASYALWQMKRSLKPSDLQKRFSLLASTHFPDRERVDASICVLKLSAIYFVSVPFVLCIRHWLSLAVASFGVDRNRITPL